MGVARINPPCPLTYELTNAQTSHVTASVAQRSGTAQKQKCCRPFSGRAVSSAKGFCSRYLARTAQIQTIPPPLSWKKREREKRRKRVRKFFFTELIFPKLAYFCKSTSVCGNREVLTGSYPVVWYKSSVV